MNNMNTDEPINGFTGEYRFLSNFWTAQVYFDGLCYPTVEHAYQAAKTLNLDQRDVIRQQITPGNAKKLGAVVDMRSDWDDVKIDIMYELNKQKFFRDPDLRNALLQTSGRYIEETNHWGETFWGVCNGVGQNNLGKILMKIREELIYLEESMGVNLRNT
jgi:ribA/ribD-fused uncharacterized protein